jgi:hypothetical protein
MTWDVDSGFSSGTDPVLLYLDCTMYNSYTQFNAFVGRCRLPFLLYCFIFF